MQNAKRKRQNYNSKVKTFHFLLLVSPFYFLLLALFGCATSPYIGPATISGVPGIYHHIEKGQTLWRISKIYSVDLEEIARINRITDATKLEVGSTIFIPNRQRQQNIPVKSYSDDFTWPVRGKVISTFGQNFNSIVNKGLNIAPYGNGDIVAARSGKVVFYSENFGGYARTIIIDHLDGFLTVYSRLAQANVKVGDNLAKGAVIARTGTSARDKFTYLHFEIRKGHIPKNPLFYLP
jgi:LysM repeat protein